MFQTVPLQCNEDVDWWLYSENVCSFQRRRQYRTSISAYFKDDATTIQTIAQQIARNMGIDYDYQQAWGQPFSDNLGPKYCCHQCTTWEQLLSKGTYNSEPEYSYEFLNMN